MHNGLNLSIGVKVSNERPAGFTLVELLLAIAVIGSLAGLLFPAIEQSRAAARRSQCQSNLRQWAFAAHAYADVHHGRLPRRGQGVQPIFLATGASQINRPDDWFNALPPFMEDTAFIDRWNDGREPRFGDNSIWLCPDAERPADKVPRGFLPYSMNMALSVWSAADPDSLDRVGPLQVLVFMTEGNGLYASTIPDAADYSPVARHDGLVNIAFLDAHVAAFEGDYVGCNVGVPDPELPNIQWYTPNGTWARLPIRQPTAK